MNKYQEKFLEYMRKPEAICGITKDKFIQTRLIERKVEGFFGAKVSYESYGIMLYQNDDISIKDYHIIIYFKSEFKTPINCYYFIDNSWIQVENTLNEPYYIFDIDLEKPFSKIKIESVYNLIVPIEIPVTVVLADKEKYYVMQEEKNARELLKNASVRHSVGADLVNIYFQPCSDKYDRTEIELFSEITNQFKKVTGYQLLAKYKVDKEMFFKSISGLAFGLYAYQLTQYDDKGNVLIQTDKIEFSISKPAGYSGRKMVVGINGAM